jgi:tetratricopeptide (TPR) repeat protein
MRADTSAVTKRRVDARRWNVAASASDEWLDPLSARRLGPDGRIIAKQSKELKLPSTDAAPLPDAEEAHYRTVSLCEEQELWSAANWHLQRCNPGAAARHWQEIRIAFGAKDWPQVLKLCAAAPAELAQTARFLKLKAETLMAGSGDARGLTENLQTLREWEKVEPENIMVPLRIAEVQYLLGQLDEADQTLKLAIEREQAKVKSVESESGALPSLWQRRAELCWLAMAVRGEDQSWIGRYQEAALALLANFRDSADNGGVVAWPFALAPQTLWKDHPEIARDPKGFWEKIVDLADKAVEIDPSNFYRLNTLGALLVRGNRFEEAIPWLEESRRSWSRRPDSNNKVEAGRPLDWCFLALAHAGVASQPELDNVPKRLYHQKRAEYFTGLVTARESLNVTSGGSVWREELARRELDLLADEVQKTLSK